MISEMEDWKNGNESAWTKVKRMLGIESNKRVTAEDVYFRTKYGDILNAEHYVSVAQDYIRQQIDRSVAACSCSAKDAVFRTFYCIVDLEPEMHAYTDEIFSPFKEAGFAVAKLSGVVPEVQSELVFLVSWDCRNGVVRREEIDDSIV